MKFTQLLLAVVCSVASVSLAAIVPVEKRVANATASSLCPGGTYTLSTYLQVTDPTGSTSYGYLTPNEASGIGQFTYGVLGPSNGNPLYQLTSCADALQTVTSITASNAQTNPGSAIGLIAYSAPNGGFPQLASGSSNWAALFASPYTAPGSLPVQGTNDIDGWYESSVWRKNCRIVSGRAQCFLDPVWVNPDGTSIKLTMAAAPGQGYMMLTGDYNAFVDAYSYVGNFVQVRFLLQ